MRASTLLLLTPALFAPGCGEASAVEAEAAFATWLAGLPEPVPAGSFSCSYAATAETTGLAGRMSLRAGGLLLRDPEGRLRIDCDVEFTPPDIIASATGANGGEFRIASRLVFDGVKGWLEVQTDAGWLSGLAAAQGFDLDTRVMTLQAATIEQALDGFHRTLQELPELAAARDKLGDGESGEFGPAHWVFMVGRESEVLSFRESSNSVEVSFGLEGAGMMPNLLPGPATMMPTAEGLAEFEGMEVVLRMIFDARTGFTRAVRLELDWQDESAAGNTAYARLDLGEIDAELPDPANFVYDSGGRTEVPFDALAQPLLQQLPQAADDDEDL